MATGAWPEHDPREGDITMSREERQPGSAPSVFDDMYPYRGRFERSPPPPPTGRDRAPITSGGSESIMLPMLAYREQARAVRGITAPEMVVPDTIHPAFEKGAYYFGIRLVRVPVGADFLADVEAMRAAITPDTIA